MTNTEIKKGLKILSPRGAKKHTVIYKLKAMNVDDAWRIFYEHTSELLEACTFYTSTYIVFEYWNHIITDVEKELNLISKFKRSDSTPIKVFDVDDTLSISELVEISKKDDRIKNFLHCYRMVVILDSPYTRDAYEKYLILACESLAGEKVLRTDRKGNETIGWNKEALIEIIGEPLYIYFFEKRNKYTGKTIRNANMHIGKSPNEDFGKTLELVVKLRKYLSEKYCLSNMKLIDVEHSPTRGKFRYDGEKLIYRATIDIQHIENLNSLMDLDKELIVRGQDGRDAMKEMRETRKIM